jgi:transporter family protein
MNAFVMAGIAACAWGSAALVEKIGLRNATPGAGVVARSMGVLIGCGVYLMFRPMDLANFWSMDLRSKSAIMAGGILASVAGQVFFYRALKIGEMSRVAAVGGAWPVIAFFLGLFFLGEPFTLRKALGVTCVTVGVVLLR